MADEIKTELSEEESMKQMAAQMRAAEYKGLSEDEICEREQQKEMRKKENIKILNDTLSVLEKGCYKADGQEIKLKFSVDEMKSVKVFLPEDIDAIRADASSSKSKEQESSNNTCTFSCENIDALVLAQKKYLSLKEKGKLNPKVLVLNLASAKEPGGHTRKGASAQEEDLCRRTSLLLSLESDEAKKYYDYNNSKKTHMGSDGILISPNVEVIKDDSALPLSKPFPISVMSCAAPMVRMGLEGMSQSEFEAMFARRIEGLLLIATKENYRNLILGAFGCGVYGNDASIVSDLFYNTIKNFSFNGMGSAQLFDSIDFAVLCRNGKDYNYREFCRNFSR